MNGFRLIATLFSLMSFISAYAQSDTYRLSGQVHDNFTDAGLDSAKVYLMNKDSVILDSALTKYARYSFNVKRDKSFRSCIIKVACPHYQTHYSNYSLKYVGKNATFKLPTIFIKRQDSLRTER